MEHTYGDNDDGGGGDVIWLLLVFFHGKLPSTFNVIANHSFP